MTQCRLLSPIWAVFLYDLLCQHGVHIRRFGDAVISWPGIIMGDIATRCTYDENDDDCDPSAIMLTFTRVIARNYCFLQTSNHRKLFTVSDTHLTKKL
jgi:hypothetical protein